MPIIDYAEAVNLLLGLKRGRSSNGRMERGTGWMGQRDEVEDEGEMEGGWMKEG
jgi:hypothetical protein